MVETYRYFDHEADIGIEGFGSSPEAAFVQAARAMFAIMAEPDAVLPERCVKVEFAEADLELALVTWLNQLLAQARLHGLVFNTFALKRSGDLWQGEAWGMPWRTDSERGTEVKGATLTMLNVAQNGEEWIARCVVDV